MRLITKDLSIKFKNMALLCSLMVVFIHCVGVYCKPNVFAWYCLRDGLCRVAVPTFFLMSGFFLAGKSSSTGWWKHEVGKRCITLLIPFAIWNTLFLILHLFRAHLDGGMSFRVLEIFAAYGLNPLVHPANGPLWYIRALFIIVLLSPIVVWAVKGPKARAAGSLLLLFVLYGIIGPWEGGHGVLDYIFRKTIALQGVFYFTCGAAFRYGSLNLKLGKKWALVLLSVSVLFLGVKVLLQINGTEIYRYAGMIAVPFAVVALINLMPAFELPNSITSLAFPVYLFHQFVVNVHLFALNKWGGYAVMLDANYDGARTRDVRRFGSNSMANKEIFTAEGQHATLGRSLKFGG